MKYLILFSVIFALSFVAVNQEAFAILGCDNPHCYSLVQSNRFIPIDGVEYNLDSPDLFIDQAACENIAVSTGWLTDPTSGEWVESDDSTQSVLEFTTLSTGVLPFVSGIDLSAVYNGDTVDLSWLDSNDIGENRYRVERAVNYGEYELTSLAPRFDTLISDDVEPHWDSISYKVFERLGTQKLYSNEITINIP